MTGDPQIAVRDDGCEAGFTLIELLVALALFSLLVTVLFDNVRFGLRAWQQGSSHSENIEHSMIAQDLLRRMIENIYPMLVTDGGAQQRIDFDGAKDAIGFLGNAPMAVSGGGRFRFKIFVEHRPDRAQLVMSSTPELASPRDTSMTATTVLLTDIDRAEFSYFGKANADRTDQWHESWTERGDMPGLVRIRVAFRSGDTRLWPELLIAPHVTADVGCVYDPMTTRCRGR